jgi:hypothetical protein
MNTTNQTEQKADSVSIEAPSNTSGSTELGIRLASCDAAQAPVPPRRRSLAGAWIAFAVVVAVLVGFAVLVVYQLHMRSGN